MTLKAKLEIFILLSLMEGLYIQDGHKHQLKAKTYRNMFLIPTGFSIRDNRTMTLTICFNYGGRAEIVDAVKALMSGGVTPDKVTEQAIAKHLYYPDMPEPDVVIRTSGEHRISNFLLWELAYAEFVFTDVLWPDFTRTHLFDAVREYQGRDRRFGGVDQ